MVNNPTIDLLRRAVLLLAAQVANKGNDWEIQAKTREALIAELKRWGLWDEEAK